MGSGSQEIILQRSLEHQSGFLYLVEDNLPTIDLEDEEYKILIGKQTSKGIELSVNGEITPSWSVASITHIRMPR